MHSRKNQWTFFCRNSSRSWKYLPSYSYDLYCIDWGISKYENFVAVGNFNTSVLQLLWKGSSGYIILKDSSKGLQVLKIS